MKRILGLAACTAMLLSLISCGGEKKSAVAVNEKGEILQLNTVNNPESGEYDPAGAAAFVYFSYQTYTLEGLVGYDENGAIVPAAAESWDISADKCTYTFHIREDEKWSDGSDVTSYDFKNTMVRALNPDNGAWYVDFLFYIKNAKAIFDGKASMQKLGVACLDDKTLEITLESPCAFFLDLCKLPTYMPSNCKYAKDDDKLWDMDPAKNLGNGPWHMVERKPGEYVRYEKNQYYHDADSVNVLAIKERYMDDDQAKSSAYKTGELTMLSGAPSSLAEAYEGEPDLLFVEVPQTNYIVFNHNIAPFDNPLVRKAFAMAVNRQDISTVVGKSCSPSKTLVGKFYKSKVNGTRWGDLQGDLLEEDLEKAKALLAEAGYPEGKGLPAITYTYPAMNYEGDVAQVLQQQWKLLGADVTLEAMEYEVYVDERRNGKLQCARMQWYADYNDPTSWIVMYQSENALNDNKWVNAEYDALIAESDLELDAAKREELLRKAEKIIVSDETVICPLFTNNSTNLFRPGLTNYYYDVLSYPNYKGMKFVAQE